LIEPVFGAAGVFRGPVPFRRRWVWERLGFLKTVARLGLVGKRFGIEDRVV
jgi:hypothetical protein